MITVASSTSTNWNWGGSTATLRFFPTEAFITSAGVNVLQGNVSQNEYYFSVSCTVSGNTLTIPQFTIDATTDGTPVTARYNAWLYDSNGTKRKLFLGNFAVPHNIASTSWENIVNYNDANPIIRPSFDVYTKDQVDALISNNSASVATLASTYGNSIATAVSTIGSSEVDLVIDADTTVSATTVIPSNIRVRIEGEPLISVASGQTLTINHMAPLGHQKVFDTSAGGTVVLPSATFDHVKLAWWGGTDSSDKTSAFNAAIANCSTNGGGTIKLIDGIVNVAGELTALPGDIVVEGVGSNRDGSARTALTLTGLTSTYIFKITGGLINFTFRNLTVDLSTSTTCSAVIVDVADGETAADIVFDNFAVRGTGTSAVPQLYFSPNSLVGEIQSVRFLNGCQFVPGPSTSAIKCRTADSWFYFQQPKFSMGANAVGFEVAGVGSIEMDQPLFVGTGTQGYSDTLNRTITASITTGTKNVTLTTGTFSQSDLGQKITIAGAVTSSYIDSITSSTTATIHDNATATVAAASTGIYRQSGDATMPLAGLKVTGTFTNITLNSSQDEGLQNFITQTGSALRGTITVNSALIQSPITAAGNATVILNECHTWSGTLNDSSGAATVFRVRGGFLGEITWGTSRTLLTPSIWGVHDGASFLAENTAQVSQVYTTGRRQSFGIPTDIKHDNAYVGNPETTVPVLGVGSAFVDKPLIRIGQTDTVTNDWTQYYEMARVSSGHLSFTGNQTGFKGYDFDAIVKAQLLTFGTTSITPDNPTNVFASEGSVCLLTPTQDTTLNLANPIKANLLFFIQILTSGTTSYTVTFGTGFAARGVLVTGTSSGTLHTIGFMTNNGATVAQEIYRTTTQIPDPDGKAGKILTSSDGAGLEWTESKGSLFFDATSLQSVNHGVMFRPNVNYSHFFWEAWVKPYSNGTSWLGYFVSDTHGGDHNILWGCDMDSNGHYTVTGNIWNGAVQTFSTNETFSANEWHLMAVGWDGSYFLLWVDGILSNVVPYSGIRFQPGGANNCLHIGGSDHNNYWGNVAMIRGYEGYGRCKTNSSGVTGVDYTPEFYFRPLSFSGSVRDVPQFFVNYQTNQTIYPDLSGGFEGLKHDGIRQAVYSAQNSGLAAPPMNDLPVPTFQIGDIEYGVATRTAPATPASAKVWDSFSRPDRTALSVDSISAGALNQSPLGDTEAGSLGVLTWACSSASFPKGTFYIINGTAAAPYQGAHSYVSTSLTDIDIRVERMSNQADCYTSLLFRYEDVNNFYAVYGNDSGLTLRKVESGVTTDVAITVSAGWKAVRVVTSGTSITVYTGTSSSTSTGTASFTSVYTGTILNHAGATNHGLYNSQGIGGASRQVYRADNFVIF